MKDWLLVRPLVGPLQHEVGWVERQNIKVLSSGKLKTSTAVELYTDESGPPLRKLHIQQLAPDVQVRIEIRQGEWALVANPLMVSPQPWLEGWVALEFLEAV